MKRIALGTAQFGLPYGIANQKGQVSLDETRAILEHAEKAGLDTLDTAIAYGESEKRLGGIGVSQWNLISKLPAIPKDCLDVKSWVIESVEKSLERLNIRRLRGLLLHSPKQLQGKQGEALIAALAEIKAMELVDKIGASIYSPDELDIICSYVNLDIVQAPMNIVDRRMIESGWLERLSKQGIEVHIRSVFLQGLLLMESAKRPLKFKRWQHLWDQWQRWLICESLTPLQACLRYVLAQKEVHRVIVGVDDLNQFKEILMACGDENLVLPEELKLNDSKLIDPSNWEFL